MYLSVSLGHIDVASPERLELPVAACSLCGCQDQDCPDKNMCTYKWNQTKDKWWSMNTVVLLDKLLLTIFFPKKGLTSSVIFCHFLGNIFFWYHKHKVRVCKMFLHLLQSLLIYIFQYRSCLLTVPRGKYTNSDDSAIKVLKKWFSVSGL